MKYVRIEAIVEAIKRVGDSLPVGCHACVARCNDMFLCHCERSEAI